MVDHEHDRVLRREVAAEAFDAFKTGFGQLSRMVERSTDKIDELRTAVSVLNTKLEQISEMTDDHQKVLIRGNGEPALIQQMRTLTDELADTNRRLEKRAEGEKEDKKQMYAAYTALGVVFAQGVFQVITQVMDKKP